MTIEPIISTFVILYSISIGILLPASAYPTGAGGCFSSDAVDDASMFAFHHGVSQLRTIKLQRFINIEFNSIQTFKLTIARLTSNTLK